MVGMWSGPCFGGPMDTHDGVSRYPSGFVLVDRWSSLIWIYDYVLHGESPTGGAFQVRIQGGETLNEDWDAPKNRYRAGEESEFDVRAMRVGSGYDH